MTANAIAGNKIAARDLGDPWRWFRSESINTLAWHGAVSSAIAVDRLGRRDLSDRLISWALRSDPGGVMDRFMRALAAAGLDHEPAVSTDELDTLIDEVIAIADQLARHQT